MVGRNPGRVVILGAGPCGLGAAFRLGELGHRDFTIYERLDQVGGLAASRRDEHGFTWDHGVHVLFSRSDYFNGVMDSLLAADWVTQRRDAQVWMHGQFVPYPLQYNIHRLPDPMRRECLLGLARAATRSSEGATNFKEWIETAFGDGLAKHFMVPYNEKAWGTPLSEMGLDWIAERVPRPDLVTVLANFLDARDDDGWGPNASFRYPREGGAGAIWRRVADKVGYDHIALSTVIAGIDSRRRQVRFTNGQEERYDTLISTIPLDRLVSFLALDALRPAAAALRSSTVHAVGIGLAGLPPASLVARRWIYFPDPTLPFYRASIPSNFAATNAPPGHWSLMAEVSETPHRQIARERLVSDVIAGLEREGFLAPSSRIVSRWHDVVTPGYPIPTLGRDGALRVLLPSLEELGIFSRGRFGAWKYEISNQDHSFLQGAELVNRLILGKEETTLRGAGPA